MTETVLQLSNDFADQKIYINLVRRLSERGFDQIVYVPVKWEDKIDGNRDDTIENVQYHYSYILKRNLLFKLRYHRKLKIILEDLERKIDFSTIDLVHAHFLFSDGGLAYALKKKYNIPYVVSVRASDIFTFFKWMLHLRSYGNKIMMEAERVVFINHSYVDIFKKKYLSNFNKAIFETISVIPNAIEDKWFSNLPEEKKIDDPIRLLYVGRIVKRKKLDVVIKALKKLNLKAKKNYLLEVVGEGEFMETAKSMADEQVIFHGKVLDFKVLHAIYTRCHVFVMPSVKETFGLVYIEALSQGLPLVFCKGEGVDGFFERGTIGVAVRPDSVQDVVEALEEIENNYEQLTKTARKESLRFNWDECTSKFVEIYKEALH